MQARLPRGGAAVLVGVGVLLAAVGAYASIPGPDGVIHGCRHKSSGALRVIDSEATCNGSTELALDWSAAGTPSPSTAYVDSDEHETLSTSGETTLVSVQVPTGSYTIAAKTHVYTSGPDTLMTCEVRAGATSVDYNGLRLIAPANDQVVPFLGAVTFSGGGGTIALVCDALGSGVESENTRIVATPAVLR